MWLRIKIIAIQTLWRRQLLLIFIVIGAITNDQVRHKRNQHQQWFHFRYQFYGPFDLFFFRLTKKLSISFFCTITILLLVAVLNLHNNRTHTSANNPKAILVLDLLLQQSRVNWMKTIWNIGVERIDVSQHTSGEPCGNEIAPSAYLETVWVDCETCQIQHALLL